MVPVGLFPDRLRLWFNTSHGTEDGDGSVEYPKRPFYFDGKIDMARSINDVEPVVFVVVIPVNGGSCRGDGNATLLLLHHPIHGGRTIVHLSKLIIDAGII